MRSKSGKKGPVTKKKGIKTKITQFIFSNLTS